MTEPNPVNGHGLVRSRSFKAALCGLLSLVLVAGCSSSQAAPAATPDAAPSPSAAPSRAAGSPAPSAVAEAAAAEADGDAPDIFVVMVDDLGYLPDDRVLERLPNIKGLWLDGGLRFTRMFDETPLCCPARATLLSGQHTLHHGVTLNDGDLFDPHTPSRPFSMTSATRRS